jgi:hypothetical protein
MFRKIPLIRLLSLFTMSTAAMIVAPSAVADCSCMCVETTPYYVCTGFSNSQTQTAECDLLDCPVEDTEPAEEPVAAVEPPHPGLECERRSVYRPDLGTHKKYNVCKPSADEEHSRRDHSDGHARNEEAWVARRERMEAR